MGSYRLFTWYQNCFHCPLNFPKMKLLLHSRDNINHLSWCQPKDFSLTWFLCKLNIQAPFTPHYTAFAISSQEKVLLSGYILPEWNTFHRDNFMTHSGMVFTETSKHHISMLYKKYSRTSRYGHLSITDSFLCTDKILIHFLQKKPL